MSRVAAAWGGRNESAIVGTRFRAAAKNAAFANAVATNALDYDDTLLGHPGATTFPVVLALGERVLADESDFVPAIVAGYEITARVMSMLEPVIPRFERQWDLGTVQAFGSAAAAARILKLSEDKTQQLFGIVSGTAPTPLPRKDRRIQGPRSMLKSAYGWSCMTAIVGADLLGGGFTGPEGAFDGSMGLWSLASVPDNESGMLGEDLGSRWSILDTEFKPYMACRFLHPAIQALEEVILRSGVVADDIVKIEVRSFGLIGDELHFMQRPGSITDAQFSLPYVLAAFAVCGSLSGTAYSASGLEDERIRRLADSVEFHLDEGYEAAYPRQYGAAVAVTTSLGQCHSSAVQHPRGSRDSPLTHDQLRAKYESLVPPVLGSAQAQVLFEYIESDERLRVRDLALTMSLMGRE